MTTVIGGSSPSITFSDSTTQSTAALPLTGGSLTGNITSTGSISSVNTFGFKNRIINGACVIDQRNSGNAQSPIVSGGFLVDRFVYNASQASKFNSQQNAGSVTPPSGFTSYMGMTVASAYSVTSTDFFMVRQKIEGYNIYDLAWGTANAKTVTLSFWVYSSLTGTFGCNVINSTETYGYATTYTISSANTWTQVSITIPGPTSGTFGATNGVGLEIVFNLGVGSNYYGTANSWASNSNGVYGVSGAVSVVGTASATFYITGVQLEVGTQATSFDYRPYGTELQLCQRYYQVFGGAFNGSISFQQYGTGKVGLTTDAHLILQSIVPLRSAPSLSFTNVTNILANGNAITAGSIDIASPTATSMDFTTSGLTTGNAVSIFQNGSGTTSINLSAEL